MARRTTRANGEYSTVASSTMPIPGNNSAWTIYLKIRTPSSFTSNTTQMIFALMTTPGGIDIVLGISINAGGSTGWMYGDSNAGFQDTIGATSVATSTDYDLALTFNPSDVNNEYRLWVDGTNIATTAKGTSQDCSDAWLSRWSSNSHHFDGLMKAVKAWDAALSADELIGESKKMLPVRQADILWILPLIEKSDGSEPSMRDLKQSASWTSFNTPTSETGAPMAYGAPSGFVIAPPAGSVSLSGTASATSTATGSLRAMLGGTMQATSNGTAAPRLSLAGTGQATSNGTAAPRVLLSATGQATSDGSALVRAALSATGQATAGATSAVHLRLAGTMQATSYGLLSTGAVFLSGTMSATSNATGALRLSLAGTGQATALGTAAVQLRLAGTMQATSYGVIGETGPSNFPIHLEASYIGPIALDARYGPTALDALYQPTLPVS